MFLYHKLYLQTPTFPLFFQECNIFRDPKIKHTQCSAKEITILSH